VDLTLTRPCDNCPFRTDVTPYLSYERANEIALALDCDESFSCHKTSTCQGKSNMDKGVKHCAGAMIMMEKMNRPNQWMRICERIGHYDRRKLDMNSPVYHDFDHFVDAHE